MANGILDLLQRYNRISVILISILITVPLVYLSLYISMVTYLIPVAAFFVMHYLKLYKFIPRLLASMLIAFVAVLLMTGFYANSVYNSGGVETGSSVIGTNITASVTPFHEVAGDYNFSFNLSGNTSIGEGYYIVVQGLDNNYFANYTSEIISVNTSSGNRILYVHDTNLTTSGAYEYSLLNSTGVRLDYAIGPAFSMYALFVPMLLSLGPTYWITFELIFVIGLFVARSISNSMRVRNLQPPQGSVPEEVPPEPPEQN